MKIEIYANNYSITTDITVGEIETLKKYNPKALKLYADEKQQSEKFAIGYAEGKGSISSYGIVFNAKGRDGNEKAVFVGDLPADITNNEEAKNYVVEKIGYSGFDYLKELESSVPSAVNDILSAKKRITDSIEIR